jgi:hypothetical protein
MNINPQQIQVLKAKGYTDSQIRTALSELSQEDQRKGNLQNAYAQSMARQQQAQNTPRVVSPWGTPDQDNMVKWQIDVNEILEQLYHLFRSDIFRVVNGQKIWIRNKDPKKRKLNNTGTNDCMELLASYLNKNNFLANYTEEQISQIVLDISNAFKDQLYMNYERYGWIDKDDRTGGQKRTYYRTLVLQVSNIIFASYMRAWKGGERTSLRENRQVQQTEALGGMPGININQNAQSNTRGLLNPMRYIKGKYY